MSNEITVTVKWNGKEYEIGPIKDIETVFTLKTEICKVTGVKPERQKLLNLKYINKIAEDGHKLHLLNLKPKFKILMMGSLEKDIEHINEVPESAQNVINDLEVEEDEEVETERQEIYLTKIRNRIEKYSIKELNSPREGKKLLVLDIDYTLFDNGSVAETGAELMRPFLHEFLTSCYLYYDIVIWSATDMKWIEEKMKVLKVTTNPNYKIMFYLDHLAMISVHTAKYGVVEVKPLGVIWGIYKQYNEKNSLIIDDLRRNFLMNPKNGLRIDAFKRAHVTRSTDRELLYLRTYLKYLAEKVDDFTTVKHRKWKSKLARLKNHF